MKASQGQVVKVHIYRIDLPI